jgi:hypothetical protein
MGRTENKSEPKSFQISVSLDTWEHLEYMARNGIIGPSESTIAASIVTNEIHGLKKTDFFSKKVPGK